MARSALLVMLLLGGCASSEPAERAREALVSGDQDFVEMFSRQVLNDDAVITAGSLGDDRVVSHNIVVRVEEENRIGQYGVDLVSDFFMCLLQMKFHTSSRDILSDELLRNECRSTDECEVCNSLMFPLPPKVRNELRIYWVERLKQRP